MDWMDDCEAADVGKGESDEDLVAEADEGDPCIFAAGYAREGLGLVFEEPLWAGSQVCEGEDAGPEPEEDAGYYISGPEVHLFVAVCGVEV